MTELLIDAWFRAFGSAPTTPRRVISQALDQDPTLLNALGETLGQEFTTFPHPHALSRWLLRHENYLFQSTAAQPYRFTRDKQGWRLVHAPALVRQ